MEAGCAFGYLILSVPLDAWPRRLFGFLDKDETHVSIPREDGLNHMIARNSLRIIKEEKFSHVERNGKIPRIPAQIELFLWRD